MSKTVARVFETLPSLFEGCPTLVRRAEHARFVLLLEAGSERVRLSLDGRRLVVLPADGPMDGWDLALRAEPAAWVDHWQPVPGPDAFDIFGMVRRNRMRIEGDFTPLMRHLQVVKDILALPRGVK